MCMTAAHRDRYSAKDGNVRQERQHPNIFFMESDGPKKHRPGVK